MVREGERKGGSCCYRSPKAVRARSSLDLPLIGRLEIFGRIGKAARLNCEPCATIPEPHAQTLADGTAGGGPDTGRDLHRCAGAQGISKTLCEAVWQGCCPRHTRRRCSLKMQRHQIAKSGQVILSEIWGKKGAVGSSRQKVRGRSAQVTFSFSIYARTELTRHICGPFSPRTICNTSWMSRPRARPVTLP